MSITSNDMKGMIGPLVTLIFVAGGGWFTLDAVASDTEALQETVESIEQRLVVQDVLEVKVQQVQDRLEKMEALLEKTIEIQQKQMANQSAICQATQARCR